MAERVSLNVIASNYMRSSGTSVSTPLVAGVAALMKSIAPQLNPSQMRNVLRDTALNPRWYTLHRYGFGFVDAEAALRRLR